MGAIVATLWILLLNGVVGFQIIDDGTPISLGLLIFSALALFVGTGYIALDTGFSWTGHFDRSQTGSNRNIGLYVLYQLLPLVCLAGFFLLETVLVLRVLGEKKPMSASQVSRVFFTTANKNSVYLIGSALLFALGQVFQYVVSTHICNASDGKVNGALFETLFTLSSVILVWIFWSSITEDDWPEPPPVGTYA